MYIRLVQDFGLECEVAQHLANAYGDRAFAVAKLASLTGKRWPIIGTKLHPEFPYIDAEVGGSPPPPPTHPHSTNHPHELHDLQRRLLACLVVIAARSLVETPSWTDATICSFVHIYLHQAEDNPFVSLCE